MDADFEEKLMNSYPRSSNHPNQHNCPRAAENGSTGIACWQSDESCSYCGSLNPDYLMSRIEAGTVQLGPTDKNYKVYVTNDGGEAFKQTYRGPDCPGGDDPNKWVWTMRELGMVKFYFQHFTEEQKKRFVQLMNEKKLKIQEPGHFYRLPFFCQRQIAT